jgi:TolB-like protein/Flp pilus assembly protein TadD
VSLFSELKRRNVFRVAIAYSVTAWLVAQVAELAFDSFGAPDWVMKTLLFILAVGLVFAIIFAWAYELTPEGVKREKDVDRSQSITGETGRKLNYTIIGILAAALVFSVATHRWTTGEVAPASDEAAYEAVDTDKSIAVLPFVNMSDDPNNEYFSDGISEELLNVLVKVEGLRVASRTSTFSFKNTGTPIPEIARALNVEHVLEGSVRKAGNTVRVTAQLIDVSTDSHLWSETYDRKLEDIFVIQDEISAHIVEELKVALGAGEQIVTHSRPTENLAAFEIFLRGRHFWSRRGADNIRKAIQLFNEAIELDPGFARAWSSLAAAHITMPGYSGESESVHHPLALEYANKALGLEPTLAEAHAVLADLLRVDKRWSEAEAHYQTANELEPGNPTGYLWYAEHLTCTGQLRPALDNALKALELDPFNSGVNSVVSLAYGINGDMNSGRRYLTTAWELGHPGALFNLITIELSEGNVDAAAALFAANETQMSERGIAALELRIEAFRDPEARSRYVELLDSPDFPDAFAAAIEYARLGMIDEAVARIKDVDITGNRWGILWLPSMAEMRAHEVFAQLLARDGLIDYWDEIGWPDQCSRDGEKITCR